MISMVCIMYSRLLLGIEIHTAHVKYGGLSCVSDFVGDYNFNVSI